MGFPSIVGETNGVPQFGITCSTEKKKNTNHGNELFIQLPILTKLVNSTTYKVSIEWMQRKL